MAKNSVSELIVIDPPFLPVIFPVVRSPQKFEVILSIDKLSAVKLPVIRTSLVILIPAPFCFSVIVSVVTAPQKVPRNTPTKSPITPIPASVTFSLIKFT